MYFLVFFFKQKTAYEMRISDWSSDVCSSDLAARDVARKSIVLLKNEAGALPLAASAKSIAVIGPLGDSKEDMIGSWSAAGDRKTRDRKSVVEGKSVSVSVVLGGRRIIKKKKK